MNDNLCSKAKQVHPDLDTLIDLYGRGLTNFAYTYVKDWETAADLTQEVLLITYQKYSQIHDPKKLRSWLFRVTANRAKDFLRQQNRRRLFSQFFLKHFQKENHVPSTEQTFLVKDEREQIARSVLQLDIIYREIIVLYYYEMLSLQEISELLHVPLSTVKSRLQRGRQKLKVLMERNL